MIEVYEPKSIILLNEKGEKYLVEIGTGMTHIKGLGIVDTHRFIDNMFGDNVEIAGQKFIILEPSIMDIFNNIKRKAQIILPRDSAQIILNCNIKAGERVIEIGAGSGGLTIILASFVAPSGIVVSYEKRDDFAKITLDNIKKAGLSKFVEIKIQDAIEKIDEKDFNAVIIDIPDNWNVIDNAYSALKFGGHLASFSPTFNQVEQTVKALRTKGFADIKTTETLHREIIVHDKGTRPSYEMLGHTGYLTFARKVK